jgi:hypothetical protein
MAAARSNSSPHVKTRASSDCPIFGIGHDLGDRQLPTYEDVMKLFLWERHCMKQLSNKDPSVDDIARKIAEKLLHIWRRASIPTVISKRILQVIKSYHQKYRNILKQHKGRKENKSYQEKLIKFKQESMKLFDIALCKCKTFASCDCNSLSMVPNTEREFLTDQRSARNMAIGTIDIKATRKLEKVANRKNRDCHLTQPIASTSSETQNNAEILLSSSTSATDHSSEESEFIPSPPRSVKAKVKRAMKAKNLPSLAAACDRTGISDRSGAFIASCVLHDFGLISPENTTKIIDRSKVRRERKRKRSLLQSSQSTNESLCSIYFDGRKDSTLMQEKKVAHIIVKQFAKNTLHY